MVQGHENHFSIRPCVLVFDPDWQAAQVEAPDIDRDLISLASGSVHRMHVVTLITQNSQ
jgi:hypothetical protein